MLSETVKEIPFVVQVLLFMLFKINLPITVIIDNMELHEHKIN